MRIARSAGEYGNRRWSARFAPWILMLLVLLLVGFGVSTQIASSSGQQYQADVPLYGIYEISLTATGSYANPYLLMPGDSTTPGFVVGTFTGPSGQRISLDGFWDGGSTWRIRMAPTAVGAWTFVTSSADSGLNGRTGTINVTPSASKGFVRVNPNHPHHFMWDDGSPFYWAPVTTMIAHFDDRDAEGGTRRVDDGTFQSLLDTRANQAFSATHWGFYGFNKDQFNRKTQRNEGGPPFINYDPDQLNPAYYQYGDQRVKALLNRGIVPQFQLGWPDQGILNMGHPRLKRYWRYVIARYAAFNITYNLFGEVEEFGSSYLSISDDYGNLTRRWDPYGHLITTHTLNQPPQPELLSRPWLDYVMLQLGTSATSNFLNYKKPVINSEYGGYEDAQVTGEQLRPMLWDVRQRGGYFVYESWGDNPESTGAQYAKLNNAFFRDRTSYWLLEYHPEVYGGKPGLADLGREYVVYLPAGGSVTVDLSSATGTLDVEWYNPRTGQYSGQTATTGGATRTFTAPFAGDAVLHVKAQGGANLFSRFLSPILK